MAKVLYDDGRYFVTQAIVATPWRFYPVSNTTASIRREPLWIGLGIAGFVAAALAVYGDLLHTEEKAGLVVVAGLGLLAGRAFVVLRLDAVGLHRALIFGRRARIWKLYWAIRDAREVDSRGVMVVSP